MRSTPLIAWRTPPRWLYWVAAPLAPAFVALGALLCLMISVIIGDIPSKRGPRNTRF